MKNEEQSLISGWEFNYSSYKTVFYFLKFLIWLFNLIWSIKFFLYFFSHFNINPKFSAKQWAASFPLGNINPYSKSITLYFKIINIKKNIINIFTYSPYLTSAVVPI